MSLPRLRYGQGHCGRRRQGGAGVALMSLEHALADSDDQNKRHLLLGNGFSIACCPDAFSYGRLVDEADFSELSVDAAELFGLSGTSDFERVINMLRASAKVKPSDKLESAHEPEDEGK